MSIIGELISSGMMKLWRGVRLVEELLNMKPCSIIRRLVIRRKEL